MKKRLDFNGLDRFESQLLRLYCERRDTLEKIAHVNYVSEEFLRTHKVFKDYEDQCERIRREQSDYYLQLMIRILNKCEIESGDALLWRNRIRRAVTARKRGEIVVLGPRVKREIRKRLNIYR